jgi:hypothetical protein
LNPKILILFHFLDQQDESQLLPVPLSLVGSSEFMDSLANFNFPMNCFGIDCNDEIFLQDSESPKKEPKIEKLIDKIDQNLKELALVLRVHDPSKLLNVLIIKQQLNIIKPVEIVTSTVEATPRTIDDILKPPSVMQRKKPKNKNMKIKYGVMSGNQVIDEMEQRESEEKRLSVQKELDQIAKLQRLKEIQELGEKLRESRQEIKNLRAEKIEKNKAKRQKEIQELNEKLREDNQKLKNLQAENVEKNKAARLRKQILGTKRKQELTKQIEIEEPRQKRIRSEKEIEFAYASPTCQLLEERASESFHEIDPSQRSFTEEPCRTRLNNLQMVFVKKEKPDFYDCPEELELSIQNDYFETEFDAV